MSIKKRVGSAVLILAATLGLSLGVAGVGNASASTPHAVYYHSAGTIVHNNI